MPLTQVAERCFSRTRSKSIGYSHRFPTHLRQWDKPLEFWQTLTKYSGLHLVLPDIEAGNEQKIRIIYYPSEKRLRVSRWGDGKILSNDGKIVSMLDLEKKNLLLSVVGADRGCSIWKIQVSVWKVGNIKDDFDWVALYNIKTDDFTPNIGMPELTPLSIHGHCSGIAKMDPKNFGVDPI